MPRSQRGFPRGNVRARRETGWIFGPGDSVSDTIIDAGVTIMGDGLAPAQDGLTIVRIRGICQLFLTAATAGNDGFTGAIAIGIINEDAFAVGVTTIMDPLADMDWDGWMYHHFFAINSPVSADTGLESPSASQRIVVDGKAMRKITEGQVVFAAIEVVELGTATMEAHFNSRMLVKLP